MPIFSNEERIARALERLVEIENQKRKILERIQCDIDDLKDVVANKEAADGHYIDIPDSEGNL